MEIFLPIGVLKIILPLLAIIAGVFVITTKNAIISVFNLIVLYILVAFYLIYIGITYLGISYIVVYIGAIAILFLFVIMMIDIEVVEKRSNNYLPLLFLLLGGFFFTLKNILYNIGIVKMKSLSINIIKKPIIHDSLFKLEAGIDSSELNWLNEEKDNEDIELEEKTPDYFYLEKWYEELMNNDILRDIESEELKFNETEIEEETSLGLEIEEEISLVKELEWVIEKRLKSELVEDDKLITEDGYLWDLDIKFNKLFVYNYEEELQNYNYLLVVPNWDSAANRVTQISAIGDVLYTVYHSYIYIISVLLLLGMIGAIILTGDSPQPVRIIKKLASISNSQRQAQNNISLIQSNKKSGFNISQKSLTLPFFLVSNSNTLHTEGIIGNLFYFIVATLIIAALLLFINSYFSLSVKYLDKGGGFECGFTSFVQTRERFNVIFYRVSLLFLVFDLEIILIFPYTAIYQKYQNISKNNVLAFLYILIVGFIYELKEGALNIVKKAHTTEINDLE